MFELDKLTFGHRGVAVHEEVEGLNDHSFLPVTTGSSSAIFILT